MNIIFNALGCGLGNNGGTKTIVKSVEALNSLGHSASIHYNANRYTWEGDVVSVMADGEDISRADAVVNVSVWDVDSTLKLPTKKKVWWLRGWEQWVRGEKFLIEKIKEFHNSGGEFIVNSSWLIEQLREKCGVDSVLCHSGLDLGYWKPLTMHTDKITVGALWHPKHKTKNYHMFEAVKKHFENNEMYIFQTIHGNLTQPQMRAQYGGCNVWLSLSELEGFHQCPAEAALCGCNIIYYNVNSGGTRDYCSHETATPFDTVDELITAIETYVPNKVKRDKMETVLVREIGNREINMGMFVNIIEGRVV